MCLAHKESSMKMLNVYAAALALLVVSNGVKAGDMGMMGMHNGTLPTFGLKNDTKQNLFVSIITNDDRQTAGVQMSPNDVLPLSIEQWNNIKEVKVRLSGFKHRKEKGFTITDCETGEAENAMSLSDLRGNTRWNYLTLSRPTKGMKYQLNAVGREQVAAPFQVKSTEYAACVTCSK